VENDGAIAMCGTRPPKAERVDWNPKNEMGFSPTMTD